MSPHIAEAVAAWADPSKATLIGKDALLDHAHATERIPTPDEQQAISVCLASVNIDMTEWGAICLLAERIRTTRAEQALRDEADAQVEQAERFLDLTPDDFLHWPFEAMDSIMGGLAPGTLHFVVCPSKGGKTTLCRSATRAWIQQGKRIFYGGFELRAETLRTMSAADDCGLDPGDILTGAWTHWTDYQLHWDRMAAAYRTQVDPASPYQNLRFAGFGKVDLPAVREMMQQAHDWGADAVIIDHIDHIGGSGNAWDVSMRVCHGLDEMAKRYGLVVIATSQTNNEGKGRDLWRDHRPVRSETVKMGSHKMEVATSMMGFYRPVRIGLTKEERQMVELREKSVYDVLQPEVNAFCVMAHRAYGSRIGQVGYVGWQRGRIVDAPASFKAALESRIHGVRTNRDV